MEKNQQVKKTRLFKKINKIDKPQGKQILQKREKTEFSNTTYG